MKSSTFYVLGQKDKLFFPGKMLWQKFLQVFPPGGITSVVALEIMFWIAPKNKVFGQII